MRDRARADLTTFLLVQCVAVGLVGVIIGLFTSMASAVSAVLAGGSVLLGNAAYVALLLRHKDRPSVVWILAGQFVKVMLTVLFLMLVVSWYASLVWPGFLAGLFSALLVVLVAPLAMSRTQKKYDAVHVENVLKTLSKD